MESLFLNTNHDLILNSDETGWKLFPKEILISSEKCMDDLSKQSTMNEQAQVTALVTI